MTSLLCGGVKNRHVCFFTVLLEGKGPRSRRGPPAFRSPLLLIRATDKATPLRRSADSRRLTLVNYSRPSGSQENKRSAFVSGLEVLGGGQLKRIYPSLLLVSQNLPQMEGEISVPEAGRSLPSPQRS